MWSPWQHRQMIDRAGRRARVIWRMKGNEGVCSSKDKHSDQQINASTDTLQRFHASMLPRVNASTLPRINASMHQYFNSSTHQYFNSSTHQYFHASTSGSRGGQGSPPTTPSVAWGWRRPPAWDTRSVGGRSGPRRVRWPPSRTGPAPPRKNR